MTSAMGSAQLSSGSSLARHFPALSVMQLLQGRSVNEDTVRQDIAYMAQALLRLASDADIEKILFNSGYKPNRGSWLITEHLIEGIYWLDRHYMIKNLQSEVEKFAKDNNKTITLSAIYDNVYGEDELQRWMGYGGL
jgi:hypothetical protein